MGALAKTFNNLIEHNNIINATFVIQNETTN